jgi:two-component system response regulator DevR
VTAPVRLYLLDDHEIVRRGLIDLLSGEPDFAVVGESGIATGAAAAIVASGATVAAGRAGADGYLLTEVRATSLVDAIRSVAAGETLLDPTVTERVLDRVRIPGTGASPLGLLTPRETEILGLIAEGMSNREIAGALFLAEKTVKNNVSGILSKLGMQRRTQAAVLGAEWLHKRDR